MTHEEAMAMEAGPELDAAVGRVLGVKPVRCYWRAGYCHSFDDNFPLFSADDGEAIRAVKLAVEMGGVPEIIYLPNERTPEWFVEVNDPKNGHYVYEYSASLPVAICRAIMKWGYLRQVRGTKGGA